MLFRSRRREWWREKRKKWRPSREPNEQVKVARWCVATRNASKLKSVSFQNKQTLPITTPPIPVSISSAKYNLNLVCALTYDDPLLAGTAVTRFRCRGCYGQQASQSRHGRNVVLLSHHITPSVCALSLGSGGPRDRHRAEPPAAHILLRHGHVPSAAAFLDRQPLARPSSHRLGLTRPAPPCHG